MIEKVDIKVVAQGAMVLLVPISEQGWAWIEEKAGVDPAAEPLYPVLQYLPEDGAQVRGAMAADGLAVDCTPTP